MSDFGENDFEDMNGMDDMMNSMPKEPFYKDAFSGITESAQEIIVDNMPAVADTFGSTDDILDSINEQIEKVKGSLAPLEEVAIGIREGGKASVKEFQQSRDIKTAIDAYKKTSKRVQNEIAKAEEDEKRESVQREREYKEHQQKSAVQSKLGFDMTSSLKAISEKVQGSNEQLGAFVNLSMANDDNIATSTALVNSKDRQRNTNSQIMAMATFHTESLKEAKRTNALLESSLAFSTTITGPSIYAGAEHQLKLEASQQDLINLNKDTLRQLQFSAEMVQKSNISHSIKSVFDTDGNNVYRDVSDFMTYDGGLDISKISGRLLDNITPMIDILTMVPQMFGDRNMRSAMSSSINPIKSIAKQIPKQLLSAKAKDAMTKTNRSIGGLGPLLLGKLDESARGGNSISSAIQRMIGLDATPKSHAKLGQKNIPVPFDMVTRRSIVDVIPEHLSGIESALTGLPQRMFDHQGGKMTTKNQVQEKFQSRIDRMGTSPFYDIRSAMEENHDGYDPERTDDYNKIFSQMLKSGKNYNPRNITKADRKEFINILGGKKKDAGRTDQFIKDLSRLDPHISNQFLYAISAGRSEMQKDFTNLEREIGEYGGGEAIANINNENEISYLKRKIRSSDIDGLSKAGRLKIKQSNLDIEKQIENLELSRGSNINSHSNQLDLGGTISNNPITKIYDLLSKGIIVFPDNRYDAEEVGRYSMLPPHLRDIQKQQKIKYDARQILTKAKHDADLLRKSKIAEAESDYRREETETDTRFMGMKGIGEGIEGLRNKVPFNNWIIKGMGKIDEMINSALFGKIEKPEEGTSKVNIPFVLDKSSPSFMEEGPQVDLSQKTKRLAFSADGPQGLVNKMSIWSIGLMEKMNHALLGDDYDPLKNKSITSSFQDLQKNLQDKLFGNKKDGKIGLLQKLTSPLQSKAEDLKHAFMDKIGSELAHTMRGAKVNLQHGLQDATNSIKDASLGLLEKAKVKANEWKEAQKAKGDDTITSKLINKVSKKGKVIGAYAEAAKDKFGEYTEESLRRRVARGQVSQEEYDKWIDEKSSIHTKEDKRHKSVLDDIEKSKSNINLDVANSKDKNFSKDLSATEERLKTSFDNVKGMSSKDHKADKARAKKQAKINEDILKKGGALTKEQQESAMTNREKLDASRKELNTKLTEEMKRQETEKDKDSIAREVSQTEDQSKIKESVVDIGEMLSGTKESVIGKSKSDKDHTDDISDNKSSVDESVLNGDKIDDIKETIATNASKAKERANSVKDNIKETASKAKGKLDDTVEGPNFQFGFKDKRTFERTAARAKRLGISPDLIQKVADGILPLSELKKAVSDKIRGKNAFETNVGDDDIGIRSTSTKAKAKARAKLDATVDKAKNFGKSIFNNFKEGSLADDMADKEREGKNKIFDRIAKSTATTAKIGGFMFKTIGKLAAFVLSGKLTGGLKKGLSGISTVVKTLAVPLGIVLGAVPTLTKLFGVRQGANIVHDISKGNVDGVLQGTFGGNTSGFDADGNELTGMNKVAARVNLFGLATRGQKTAKKIGNFGKRMVTKGLEAPKSAVSKVANVAKNSKLGKFVGSVATNAKTGKVAKAASAIKNTGSNVVKKVSSSKVLVKVKDVLSKALSKGKLGKFVGKNKDNVIKGIIGAMKKGPIGKIVKKLVKALLSPAFLIASIIADIGTGMADVRQIFELDSSFDPPISMRFATGIAKAVSNQLTYGFVPVKFLADIIYNAIGSDENKAKLAQAQADLDQKADALGVDKKRLNALENKSTMTKIGDIFRSKKSEEKRDAKIMGMELDEYRTWKKEKDAYGKDDPKTQADEQTAIYDADKARKDGTVQQNQAKGGLTNLSEDGTEVSNYGQYTGIYDEFYVMIDEVKKLASNDDVTRLQMLLETMKTEDGSSAVNQFYKEYELIKAKIAMTSSNENYTTRIQGPSDPQPNSTKIENSGIMVNKPGITRSESKRVEANLFNAALVDKLSNMEKLLDPTQNGSNTVDNGASDIATNADKNAISIIEAITQGNEALFKMLGYTQESKKLAETQYNEKRTKERLHDLNIATGGDGKGGGLLSGIKKFFSSDDDIDEITSGKSGVL